MHSIYNLLKDVNRLTLMAHNNLRFKQEMHMDLELVEYFLLGFGVVFGLWLVVTIIAGIISAIKKKKKEKEHAN